MNNNFIRNMMSGMDANQALNMIQQFAPMLDEELKPHFEEIRERAENEDYEAARRYYESLSDEEQQEAFEKAVADVMNVLFQCRADPVNGFKMLKERIRDPNTIEPILLTFEGDSRVDPEWTKEQKDAWREIMKRAGTMIVPEAYPEGELEQSATWFGGDSK